MIGCAEMHDTMQSAPEHPKYILPIALSISVTPVTLYSHHCPVCLHHPCVSTHTPLLCLLPICVVVVVVVRDRCSCHNTHLYNAEVTTSRSLVGIMAAIKLLLHYSNQFTIQLGYLQDEKLLMVHWHWFEYIVHPKSGSIDNSIDND